MESHTGVYVNERADHIAECGANGIFNSTDVRRGPVLRADLCFFEDKHPLFISFYAFVNCDGSGLHVSTVSLLLLAGVLQRNQWLPCRISVVRLPLVLMFHSSSALDVIPTMSR
eukprot:8061259-Pyramimonas_sp.AAC.1